MVGSHQVAVGKQIRFSARTASSLNGQAVSQPHPRPFFETGSAFVALAVPNLNGWTRLASNPLSVWTFPVQGLKTRVTMISSQFFKVTFIYLHECVCVCWSEHPHTCDGQRTTCRNIFSPCTIFGLLAFEFRSLGLSASSFTNGAIVLECSRGPDSVECTCGKFKFALK